MRSRDVIRVITADGWYLVRVTGSHHHFRHAEKVGVVTVPHPKAHLPIGTMKAIERQSGIALREH